MSTDIEVADGRTLKIALKDFASGIMVKCHHIEGTLPPKGFESGMIVSGL